MIICLLIGRRSMGAYFLAFCLTAVIVLWILMLRYLKRERLLHREIRRMHDEGFTEKIPDDQIRRMPGYMRRTAENLNDIRAGMKKAAMWTGHRMSWRMESFCGGY